jgi:hypothetical protein
MMGGIEHAAELVFSLNLVTVHAGIEHAAIGIAEHQHTDGDVLAGILLRVMNDRQFGEIDIVAGQNNLFHRRAFARHGLRFQRLCRAVAKTLQDGAFRLSRIDAQREAKQRIAAQNVGRKRQVGPLDVFHTDCRIAPFRRQLLLDNAGLKDRVDRLRDADEKIRPQLPRLAEKTPQVHIHRILLL